MGQTNAKCALSILVGTLIQLSKTCMDKQFQLEKNCCTYCPEGMYVFKNCSRPNPSRYIGVTCKPCGSCEEYGQKTVSNCTAFSDTQCANISFPEPEIWTLSSLCGASVCIVAVPILVVAVCYCCKIRKSDDTSAENAFIVKDNDTV